MSEVARLTDQIKLVFEGNEEGEARFGPALWPLLQSVDSKHALHRPLPAAHNIWELVLHLVTWKRYTAARLRDESASVSAEMDWPPVVGVTESDWKETLTALQHVQAELMQAAIRLTDEQLETPCAGGKVSRYLALQGILQHDIYHGGQIALLNKATV